MKDLSNKKAAKKLIKRFKKHPDWYTQEEVLYAKMVKRSIKRNEGEKCVRECETGQCNPGCGADDGVCCESIKSSEPGES